MKCGAALQAELSSVAEAPDETGQPYATFWQRLAALMIDQAAIFAAAYIVGRPLGAMIAGFLYASGGLEAWDAMAYVGALLVAAFTSFVFEVIWVSSHLQATPGKRALRLKVTDSRGKPLGFLHAFGRYIFKALSGAAFCVGYLIQPFTPKKQALHDMLAGSLVLRR